MQGINLRRALADLKKHWSPRVLGQVNDQYIKVAKVKGEFTWHKHDNEDEMFLVVYGRLVLQFEEGEVALDAGDLCARASYIIRWPIRSVAGADRDDDNAAHRRCENAA